MSDEAKTTDRRISRAAKVLRDAGWHVSPPIRIPADKRDQCEYPDLRGEPGDTCTRPTNRSRRTKHGWLWLCDAHIGCPEAELFDERLACHAE